MIKHTKTLNTHTYTQNLFLALHDSIVMGTKYKKYERGKKTVKAFSKRKS